MIQITDVYSTWWKKFDGSKLETPVTSLRDEIIDRIKNSDYDRALSIIPFLEANANGLVSHTDIADVSIEIGMAFYRMGNRNVAEEYWKKALSTYPPECHDHAVARWLLGASQWFTEVKQVDAINNWKEAINEFIGLADLAQKGNREEDKDWYDGRTKEMEEALVETISERFQ